MIRVIEQPPLKKSEVDQAPQSTKRTDSVMTEISQIMSETEDIVNT